MTIYSIPALIAAILCFLLALIVFVGARRDRLNVAFVLFVAGMGVFSLDSWMTRQVETVEQYRTWFTIGLFSHVFVYGSLVYYVLVLTGFIDDMRHRVLGVSARVYVIACCVIFPVILVAFHVPGLVIEGFEDLGELGFDIISTPLIYVVVLVQLASIGWLFACLASAASAAAGGSPRRRFIRRNLFGLAVLYLTAIVFGIVLPALGHNWATILMELAQMVAAGMFYAAILRFQLDRYEALNLELEQKVKQRTRHLEQAQARLVQQEKLASLGDLAAGIVHEVNSPLGAAAGAVDLQGKALDRLTRAVEEAESLGALREDRGFQRARATLRQSQQTAEEAGRRIGALMQSLERFVHLDEATRKPTDLHEGLENTLTLLSRELGTRIEVERRYGELPPVPCSPGEINQVLMHLIRNAVAAIEGEGTITIRTAAEDGHAVVAIADTGAGISAERQARLFDFNFATSERRVKLGMGLVTCAQIVEHHGGEIEVQSAVGEGSTFTVRLPLD
jgi:signal transduction histidine kinase